MTKVKIKTEQEKFLNLLYNADYLELKKFLLNPKNKTNIQLNLFQEEISKTLNLISDTHLRKKIFLLLTDQKNIFPLTNINDYFFNYFINLSENKKNTKDEVEVFRFFLDFYLSKNNINSLFNRFPHWKIHDFFSYNKFQVQKEFEDFYIPLKMTEKIDFLVNKIYWVLFKETQSKHILSIFKYIEEEVKNYPLKTKNKIYQTILVNCLKKTNLKLISFVLKQKNFRLSQPRNKKFHFFMQTKDYHNCPTFLYLLENLNAKDISLIISNFYQDIKNDDYIFNDSIKLFFDKKYLDISLTKNNKQKRIKL